MSTVAQSSTNARDLFSTEQLARSQDFVRAVTLDRTGVDADKRTVPLSFSSEAPVLRHDRRGQPFYEVLDHGNVDMARMSDGAPLLYGHETRDHLGVVEFANIGADKKGRALVRFSRSAFAQEKFQDVQDGILTKTSVGYDLSNADTVADGEREGIPVYRFRNWAPYEVTLTPLPADNSVGVGRSKENTEPVKEITSSAEKRTDNKMSTATVTADYSAERQRLKDINAAAKVLAGRHAEHASAINNLAQSCGEEGSTIDQFQGRVLNEVLATRSAAPVSQVRGELGLSNKEVKRYSMLRAIALRAEGKPLDGLELEASNAEAARVGRAASGFFVPSEVFSAKRDLAAGTAANGGYTVGSTIDTANIVELLRNSSEVMGLGARVITGLVGDVSIPRVLTGATCYWVSEGGTISSTAATFSQLSLKPRRIGATVPYSKQFLAQSSLDAESFVRDDILAAMGTELDRVAISGAGAAEPLGILNLASGDRSTSVTFGAAATWAKVVSFETNVATANANKLGGSYAYLTTPATKGAWKTKPKESGQATYLWENGDIVNGYAARATNQFPSSTANQVIFGNFGQVIYGEWAGIDVTVDAITLATTAQVKITIQKLVDMVVRQGKAFAISADSGAQ
jgi:HK97 family phage major capsid protein